VCVCLLVKFSKGMRACVLVYVCVCLCVYVCISCVFEHIVHTCIYQPSCTRMYTHMHTDAYTDQRMHNTYIHGEARRPQATCIPMM
jgi:hypothetical protein